MLAGPFRRREPDALDATERVNRHRHIGSGDENVDLVTARRQSGGALAGREPRTVAEKHPHMYIAYTNACGKT